MVIQLSSTFNNRITTELQPNYDRIAMKINLYNQKGEKLKTTVELNPAIFGIKPNDSLMAQYVRVYQANQRRGVAKTKTRGEVRGGGKKPWRQKGTGRARHGSIRSPLWVGGGTTFGPQPRNWHFKMPKKMRRRALFSTLSEKAREGAILVLNKLDLEEVKTKTMREIVFNLCPGGGVLLALPKLDEKVILSARNLSRVDTVLARNLNAFEVLNAKTLILPKDSLKVIEETFLK